MKKEHFRLFKIWLQAKFYTKEVELLHFLTYRGDLIIVSPDFVIVSGPRGYMVLGAGQHHYTHFMNI